jgi:hypothetical protein
MATNKPKTKVIKNYSAKDNKAYAKYLRESCGIKARAGRTKKK